MVQQHVPNWWYQTAPVMVGSALDPNFHALPGIGAENLVAANMFGLNLPFKQHHAC
jgi:hypothetical protein